jgi:RNA polymerase sigma factor (TIGR02999 family)
VGWFLWRDVVVDESDQATSEFHAKRDDPELRPARGEGFEVTLALQSMRRGEAHAAQDLLEAVYEQLRALARARIRHEPDGGAGMTLDPTALVHEAYLRVIGDDDGAAEKKWDNRGHFFGAAALAMRRILVERARHNNRLRHGGGRERVALDEGLASPALGADGTDLVALDDALKKLEKHDARKAKVVSLRYFAGLSVEETAEVLELSPATVKNDWAFARAWLHRELTGDVQN